MVAVKYYRIEWFQNKFLLLGILLLALNGVCDGYSMQNYCDKEFSFILKSEEQISLTMDDRYIYHNSGSSYGGTDKICETKFEAWYSYYSNFMIYFDELNLDCEDGHLEFYSGSSGRSRVSGLEGDICGVSKPEGVFTVKSMNLRIRYVPKRRQYIIDIFSVVITAYGTGYCPSYGHTCSNGRCIDGSIVCNGYNSCGDNSSCDLTTAAIIGIVVGSLAGLAAIVSVVICCICCSKRSRMTTGTVQRTGQPVVVYNAQNQNRYSQPIYGVQQQPPQYNFTPPPQSVTMLNQGTPYPNNPAQYPSVPPNTSFNNQNITGQNNTPSQQSVEPEKPM